MLRSMKRAASVHDSRPIVGLLRRIGASKSIVDGKCALLLLGCAGFHAAWLASAAPPQPAPAAPLAQEKKFKGDRLYVLSKKDGSLQLVTGIVVANNLDQVNVQVAGKETKFDSELVMRIAWGEIPQSYKDGRVYLNREQFPEAAAQFRMAASDSSSRDVVKASARLLAAQALLRWGASDPLHFAEAGAEAAKFQSDFPTNREVPEARMLQARAKWMAGQPAEAAQIYKAIFRECKASGPSPGYQREVCFEAGLNAARAKLQLAPPDTLGARELFTNLEQEAGAASAALEADSPARIRLSRVQDEARLGAGFAELAGGNSEQACTFFQDKLAAQAGVSDTTRYGAAFGLARALQAAGKLREAQLQFAKVSALEHNDRDRAAAAQVGLAETTLQLADPDASSQARGWLDAVSKSLGDTLAAAKAREMLKKL